MTGVRSKLEHLEWAIQSRAKTQLCSLRLLALFEKYEDKWKTKTFSRAAQALIAVFFLVESGIFGRQNR
jgi:hypothetical protein